VGVTGQRDVDHRYPPVPAGRGVAAQRDLLLVVALSVVQHRGGLTQPGIRIDQRGGFVLVAVLPVGFHDLGQVLV
jgi:hypothetical protein